MAVLSFHLKTLSRACLRRCYEMIDDPQSTSSLPVISLFKRRLYLIENMVAKDGVEPPTPAFSAALYQMALFVERAPMRMAGTTGLEPAASAVTGPFEARTY
jgi:hypothetical protein